MVSFREEHQDDTSAERSKIHAVPHIYPGGERISDRPGRRNRFEGDDKHIVEYNLKTTEFLISKAIIIIV